LFDDRFVFRSGVISDELWAVVEPVLPSGVGRRGRPWNDHRRTLEGIAWRFRTGAPWRDLPEEFGAWQSVWERHRRWSEDGTYQRMFAAVGEHTALGDAQAAGLLSIDSTSIRAHQHAAGARFHESSTRTGGSVELQGSSRRTG
jgi:putative transposase